MPADADLRSDTPTEAPAVAPAVRGHCPGIDAADPCSTVPIALDDITLVVRARDGDAAAFEQLARRYQGRIYRLMLRMLANRADAEDLTQEVFLAAWRRLPGLRNDEAFPSWLYRIATNRCLNALRSRRPVLEYDDELSFADRSAEPERAVQARAAVAALTVALQQLTPDQRACWLLREAHGLSYTQIAAILSTTTTAVRGRIARARAHLGEAMTSWR